MPLAIFRHEGQAIDYTPSADVAAGDVVVQGDLVGIARVDIPADTLGALAVAGVFGVAKEGGVGVTFAVGDKAYWDDASKFAVATDDGGANKLLGKVVRAAVDDDTIAQVRLSQ